MKTEFKKYYGLTEQWHIEKIKCPNCSKIQDAIVKHTLPFFTFIHTCKKCGYLIMESEWVIVNKPEPDRTEQGRRPAQSESDAKCFAVATIGALIVLIGCIIYLAVK